MSNLFPYPVKKKRINWHLIIVSLTVLIAVILILRLDHKVKKESVHRIIQEAAPTIEVIYLPVKVAKTDKQKEVEFTIREIAYQNNFKYPDYLVRLSNCESGLRPKATNLNNGIGRGVDSGAFQINDKYHAEVPKNCSLDLKCATEWTMWMINSGRQKQWACDSII